MAPDDQSKARRRPALILKKRIRAASYQKDAKEEASKILNTPKFTGSSS